MPRVKSNRWSSLVNKGSSGAKLGKFWVREVGVVTPSGRNSKLTPASQQETPLGIRQTSKLKWFRLHLTFISGFVTVAGGLKNRGSGGV